MSEMITAIRAALELKGARTHVEERRDGTWCANLGNEDQCLVENAAVANEAGVEAFFREQAAVYFPAVELPT